RRCGAVEAQSETWRRGDPRDVRRGDGTRERGRTRSGRHQRCPDALARVDERKSRVIELRFFGGLSVEETAVVLKVSPDTVTRDGRLAKPMLLGELRRSDSHV